MPKMSCVTSVIKILTQLLHFQITFTNKTETDFFYWVT